MSLLIAVSLLSASTLAAEPLWLAKEVTPEMVADGTSFTGTWKWLSASRFRYLGSVHKRFQEQAGGVLAPTPDDGCVAYFLSYLNPAGDPSARLVRLDGNGKILWDLNFPGGGAPNAPYANDGLELRSDGSVLMKGIIQVSRGVEKPWTAVVSMKGKLISSEPSVSLP